MPKQQLYDEDFHQDWEPAVLNGGQSSLQTSAKVTFGSQLIEARRLAQETQLSVAQSIGVPLSTLESWEKNETRPTKSQLVRLNRILRCEKKLK